MTNFEEELCGCCSDVKVCLWGWCVPFGLICIQASAVNKATGTGATVPCLLVVFLGCIGGAINRGKIREHYGIHGSFINDCFTWAYCAPCAACQEYREVSSKSSGHHHHHQ